MNLTAGEPERVITLQVNQTAAHEAGLSSESIAPALNAVWSGSTVTTVRDQNPMIAVEMRLDNAARQDLSTLSGMLLMNDQGDKIPLVQVATLAWGR